MLFILTVSVVLEQLPFLTDSLRSIYLCHSKIKKKSHRYKYGYGKKETYSFNSFLKVILKVLLSKILSFYSDSLWRFFSASISLVTWKRVVKYYSIWISYSFSMNEIKRNYSLYSSIIFNLEKCLISSIHYLSYPIPKVQQTKILVMCQRFSDLFLFGLVWQYSSVQTKYNKGRFKVMATYLQQ